MRSDDSGRWASAVAVIACIVGLQAAGFGADSDAAAVLGRWTSADGDVVEFRTRDTTTIGILVEASPAGLGRYFTTEAEIMRDVRSSEGRLSCTLAEGQRNIDENPAAHTADYIVIGGPAEAAAAGDLAEFVLQWQPVQRRHFLDEDGWFLRAEELPTRPPPVILTLRRAPALRVFLVRGDQLAPADALFHGVEYVAEFETSDRRLPLTINLQLAAAGETLLLEADAISDGARRNYRTKPFILRMKTDAMPLP